MDQNFIPRRYYRHGYLNGSGLPVKFMDEEGTLLDIYEQNTHITDDGSVEDLKFLVAGYSQEEVLQIAFKMLDDCADCYHGVFQPSFHPCLTTREAMWLLEALAERCWERNIPMVGGDAWVRFNDARREMKVAGLAYDARRGRLVFTLSSKSAVVEITWMLPARFGGRFLKAVRVNEETVCWTLEPVERDAVWAFHAGYGGERFQDSGSLLRVNVSDQCENKEDRSLKDRGWELRWAKKCCLNMWFIRKVRCLF